MKWILLILLIGLIRGILLPDYRWAPNIWLIPFVTPVALSALAVYLASTKRLGKGIAITTSLLSLLMSTGIGVLVYGGAVGWQYVTEDTESQAVFLGTIGIQLITYIVATLLFSYLATGYNKQRQRMQ
ncbi:hypothetical protein K0J45_01305 [Shewanella alkalitolerans]|uniref:hypothetical protein n=1 Tax=Shewanella alkalitolerans TaxID=2864209 RepID=UPI001C65B608|nr:hypothetical protein [Shewanella alkalitolerans]QYJ97920.1 hypothetical protein K0J45_01305 [Shewanella alkalitolerans]